MEPDNLWEVTGRGLVLCFRCVMWEVGTAEDAGTSVPLVSFSFSSPGSVCTLQTRLGVSEQ